MFKFKKRSVFVIAAAALLALLASTMQQVTNAEETDAGLSTGNSGSVFSGNSPLAIPSDLWPVDITPIPDTNARTPELASAIRFKGIANNEASGAAIDYQGYVWTWGHNANGKLGAGVAEEARYFGGMKRLPFFVDNDIKVKEIVTSYRAFFALTEDGKIYAWGNGARGKMGNNSLADAHSPVKVQIPETEKVIAVESGDDTSNDAVFAVTESGKVYAWGIGGLAYGRRLIPISGLPNDNPVPMEVPALTALVESEGFKEIAMGYHHVLFQTEENLYSWGMSTYGVLGRGAGAPDTLTPTKIPFFEGKEILDIDVDYYTNLVLTSENEIYRWGSIAGKLGSYHTTVNSPELTEIDTNLVSYVPTMTQVQASRYGGSAVDHHGRIWVFGYNVHYNFLTDGQLFGTASAASPYDFTQPSRGKLNQYLSKFTQLPRTMGDGDTESALWGAAEKPGVKSPVFTDVLNSSLNARTSITLDNYRNYGNWSELDGKHPTIYDKKYYQTVGTIGTVTTNNAAGKRAAHSRVYLIDEEGNKLVYVVHRSKNLANAISGNYYIASDNYTGDWFVDNRTTTDLPAGVTEKTSVPAIKESERSWIELSTGGEPNDFTGKQHAVTEVPFVDQLSLYESTATILDSAGNIYKQTFNGSGNIAWGWDYVAAYDHESNGNPTVNGLYDSYCYELMFMRGAPRATPGDIKISAPMEKHYKSQNASENVKIEVGLGSAYHSPQLNLTIEPELKDARYVVMPYDSDDPNSAIVSPTEDEFNAAYTAASTLGYTAFDLAEENGWKGIKQGIGQPEVKLTDESITIEDNCIVWVLVKTDYYQAEPVNIQRKVFDNFYTDATIKHQGVEHDKTSNILYKATDKNVTKVTNDGIAKLVGFPLDKNGKIIGTPTAPPTFGYDKAKVAKLSDAEWSAIFDTTDVKDELVTKHRQDLVAKTKKDFEDSGNTWTQAIEDRIVAWINTWIEEWVEDEWLPKYKAAWEFYTPQAAEKTYELNGVADATNNDNLEADEGELAVCENYTHSFHYQKKDEAYAKVHYLGVDDEGEKLDPFKMASEDVLRDVSYKRIPPDLLVDSVEYTPDQYKQTNGTPATTFPINVTGATDIGTNGDLTFKVPASTAEITVNVIYKAFTSIQLHVRQVIQNPNSSVKKPSNGFMSLDNVKLPSYDQMVTRKNITTHSGDINKTVPYNEYTVSLEKGYKGIKVNWITPQYYEYIGFVLSEAESGQDITNLNNSKNIHLDCDGTEEYWLTIYLEPDTTINDYAWDQKTNDFGKIKVP
ncbi:hypothetical protein NRIC_17620 [Enterococcus florum]|uniref:Uncharacterized protein n=1 Tax=Enterococcus florum TaxID=2480627 RepID=A0A4P5PC55_9ENTE|nr:hypothetical protein [Enterococcus florum]GCF93871.1 hypothetical protein NRIC_17620 [Enterococcus florum]